MSADRRAVSPARATVRTDVTAGNAYYVMQDGLALPDTRTPAQGWTTDGVWALYLTADRMSRGARMIEYWHWHTLPFGAETRSNWAAGTSESSSKTRRRVSNDLVNPVPPMLATLGTLPTGGGWAYEYKWDGVRAVVYVSGDDVRILSRNERDVTASYPDIADAVRGSGTLILDGEIVAPDAQGRPSFGRLQRRMNVRQPTASLVSGTPLHYNVFDLLSQDDESLLSSPYTSRRARLSALSGFQVTPSFVQDTPDSVVDESRRLGLEGVVAKRLDSPYEPGRRSPYWIKAPFIRTQEVVILGFKEGEGRRAGTIGALLVGLYRGGKLSFAGGVGTGFTDAALHALQSQLTPLITSEPPADDVPRRDARGAIWVSPTVVGEVEYRSFTDDGRLRHSSWRGLRPDRRPDEAKNDGLRSRP